MSDNHGVALLKISIHPLAARPESEDTYLSHWGEPHFGCPYCNEDEEQEVYGNFD